MHPLCHPFPLPLRRPLPCPCCKIFSQHGKSFPYLLYLRLQVSHLSACFYPPLFYLFDLGLGRLDSAAPLHKILGEGADGCRKILCLLCPGFLGTLNSVLEILSTLFVDLQLGLGCLEALADRLGQAVDPLPQWIDLIH